MFVFTLSSYWRGVLRYKRTVSSELQGNEGINTANVSSFLFFQVLATATKVMHQTLPFASIIGQSLGCWQSPSVLSVHFFFCPPRRLWPLVRPCKAIRGGRCIYHSCMRTKVRQSPQQNSLYAMSALVPVNSLCGSYSFAGKLSGHHLQEWAREIPLKLRTIP